MADIESPDRVGVKVWPDLRKFLPDLRASLKRIEKQVKAEIRVEPDVKHLQAAMQQAAAAASRAKPVKMPVTPEIDGKKYQDSIDRQTRGSKPASLPVMPNMDGFLKQVQRDSRKALESIEVKAPLTVDGENMRREAARAVASLEQQIQRMAVEVPLNAGDSAKARAEMSAQLSMLQAAATANAVEIPVDLNDGEAAAAGVAATREANAAAGPIRLKVNVDRDALSKALGSISMPSLSFAPKVAGITALAIAISGMLPAIAALGVGLAQMTPLLLGIPALAVGAAAGVATLMVGLSGVGTALGAAGEGGEKYAEAMANIAPNARSFVRGVNSLRDSFKGLQLGVQNELFAGMGREIRSLGQAYLPVLTKGMGSLAGAINGVGTSWMSMARSSQSLRDTSTMFDNISKGLEVATPGITAFADGLRTLARIGSTFLPSMGASFTDLGERFRDWVNMGDESGSIERMLRDAAAAASDFGSVLGSLGSIIGGVFTALANAVGGDPMGSLADGLDRVADKVNGPAFQTGLTTFFEGMRDGWLSISGGLGDLGAALGQIAPGLADFSRAFGAGFGQVLSTVASLITENKDTINSFFQAFADASPKVQGLVVGFMLLAPVIMSAVSAVAGIVTGIAGFVAVVGTTGLIVAGVVAAIVALGVGLFALYTQSEPVRALFAEIGGVLLPLFQQAFATLAPILQQIGAAFVALGSAIATHLMPVFQFLAPFIQATFQNIVTIVQGVLTVILGVIRFFTAILKGDWSAAWSALGTILSGIWMVIKGIVLQGLNQIKMLLSVAWAVIKMGASLAWTGIKNNITMVWAAIKVGISASIAVVKAVLSAGWAVIKAVTSAAWNGIKALVLGAWNGIKAAVSAGIAMARAVVTAGWNGIKAVTSAVWNGIKATLSSIWGGIKATVSSAVSGVRSVVTSTWNTIKGATSAAWNGIKGFVTNGINGAKAIATNAVNAIRSAVTGAWNTIKSATSSAWNTFKSLIQSAINGAKSAVSNGISNIVSTVQGIPGKVRGALGSLGNTLKSAGRELIQGLINGITEKIGALKAKMGSVARTIKNHMPGSPVKEGPLRSWNYGGGVSGAGRRLADGIAEGLVDRRRNISRASSTMASAITSPDASLLDFGTGGSSGSGATAAAFSEDGIASIREAVRAGAYSGTAQQRADTYARSASIPRGRGRG